MSTKALQLIDFAPSIGNLDAYLTWVNTLPMLTADEEANLATRWQQQQDAAAAKVLVLAHLRYVVRVARGYLGYGLGLGDLIQEGTIGLMKAVKRFDPAVGARLVTVAMYWIKAEIHEFVIKNWRIVKIATTKAQRKLFFKLRQHKKALTWMTKEEVADVAKDLQVSLRDVAQMELRLRVPDVSFDIPVADDHVDLTASAAFAPIQYLEDQHSDPARVLEQGAWQQLAQTKLLTAVESLAERDRLIVEARWLADDKKTLQELAAELGVSAERVRQLEKQALQRLQTILVTH